VVKHVISLGVLPESDRQQLQLLGERPRTVVRDPEREVRHGLHVQTHTPVEHRVRLHAAVDADEPVGVVVLLPVRGIVHLREPHAHAEQEIGIQPLHGLKSPENVEPDIPLLRMHIRIRWQSCHLQLIPNKAEAGVQTHASVLPLLEEDVDPHRCATTGISRGLARENAGDRDLHVRQLPGVRLVGGLHGRSDFALVLASAFDQLLLHLLEVQQLLGHARQHELAGCDDDPKHEGLLGRFDRDLELHAYVLLGHGGHEEPPARVVPLGILLGLPAEPILERMAPDDLHGHDGLIVLVVSALMEDEHGPHLPHAQKDVKLLVPFFPRVHGDAAGSRTDVADGDLLERLVRVSVGFVSRSVRSGHGNGQGGDARAEHQVT